MLLTQGEAAALLKLIAALAEGLFAQPVQVTETNGQGEVHEVQEGITLT